MDSQTPDINPRAVIGNNGGPPLEPVWVPIKGTSQEWAICSPCDVTLYTGTRGPGKSDTQLMYFRRYVGQGYGKFWRGVIFDRQYKNLDDLVSKSKRWFPAFEDGCKFLESKADYKWVWPTGEELMFRSAESVKDYVDYHGQEFPYIGWNELTNYQTLDLFDMMMSCNRSSYVPHINGFIGSPVKRVVTPEEFPDLTEPREVPVDPHTGKLPPPIPLRSFATTNPHGVGHNAVKQRFIDVAPYGQVVATTTKVYNPRTKQDEDVRRTQVALFGSWRENVFLDGKYIAFLRSIKDPNLRRAWEMGDWDIVAGGPLDDVWARHIHVIPRFKIPAHWRITRAYDWGSMHPASYGLFAEANGEEAYFPDGTPFNPPAGTLIQFYELYLAEALGTNKGLRWSSTTQARTFKAHEIALYEAGWINGPVYPGPADNQIRNVVDSDNETIEKKMQNEGITFTDSDKSPGSRVTGLELIRERLDASKRREGPGLYFTQNCIASITTIPAVPRSEKNINDVDTNSEDHAFDMLRYRVLAGSNRAATNVQIVRPT